MKILCPKCDFENDLDFLYRFSSCKECGNTCKIQLNWEKTPMKDWLKEIAGKVISGIEDSKFTSNKVDEADELVSCIGDHLWDEEANLDLIGLLIEKVEEGFQ